MDDINITPYYQKPAHRETLMLDKEFILTQDKTLVTGTPYLYSEGVYSIAVRLLEVWKDYEAEDQFVYLLLQELETNRTFKVSWNLDYDSDYYLWSIADLPTIMNMTNQNLQKDYAST